MKVGNPGADGVKYRIYVDEVGNPDLESSDNPNHRYLSLTGVILELDYVQTTLHPQLEALKLKHFRPHPDEPIILHRKEMIHAVEPFAALVSRTRHCGPRSTSNCWTCCRTGGIQ